MKQVLKCCSYIQDRNRTNDFETWDNALIYKYGKDVIKPRKIKILSEDCLNIKKCSRQFNFGFSYQFLETAIFDMLDYCVDVLAVIRICLDKETQRLEILEKLKKTAICE